MKRLSLILLILAGTGWAAIAKVPVTANTPAAVTHSTASTTCANGVNLTGNSGDLYMIVVSLASGGTVTSVADNKAGGTNSYTKAVTRDNGGHVEVWYTISTGSATVVTATFTSQKNSCAVLEYSGVIGVSSLTYIAKGTDTAPKVIGATTAASSVLVGGMSDAPSTATWSANTGTLEANVTGGSTTTPGAAVVDSAQASVNSSVTLQATLSASKSWAVAAVELMTVLPAPSVNGRGTATYSHDISVTLSDDVLGTAPTICYTTDGSTPAATTPGTCSTGSTYSSALAITVTGTTLKALATKSGWTNSVVTSATYTLNANSPYYVRSAKNSCATGGTTCTITFSNAASAGNGILVFVRYGFSTSAGISSVTDNQSGGSNNYGAALFNTNWGVAANPVDRYAAAYLAKNITGGSTLTTTVTFAGATTHDTYLLGFEIANLDATNPVDVTLAATGTGGPATSVSTGNLTTTNVNDELFTQMWDSNESVSSVKCYGSGWFPRNEVDIVSISGGAVNSGVAEEENTTTAGIFAGTTQASPTQGCSSIIDWVIQTVAIKPPQVASSCSNSISLLGAGCQ